MTTNTDQLLPRDHEAEQNLIRCIIGWPHRAPEVLPLVEPRHFLDELHQLLWKSFKTQLETNGAVDALFAAIKLGCAQYLNELSVDCTTTAHAEMWAESVREKATARALHEVLSKGADALLRGRMAESVLAQLELALPAFHEGSTA
jgi:replicative DNA helicase